ncbi:MAG: S8 family serine peptidase [Candidatus Woesearchaeota archaeon]
MRKALQWGIFVSLFLIVVGSVFAISIDFTSTRLFVANGTTFTVYANITCDGPCNVSVYLDPEEQDFVVSEVPRSQELPQKNIPSDLRRASRETLPDEIEVIIILDDEVMEDSLKNRGMSSEIRSVRSSSAGESITTQRVGIQSVDEAVIEDEVIVSFDERSVQKVAGRTVITARISKEDLDLLDDPRIQGVVEDMKVQSMLMEAIPLVQADAAWNFDFEGNQFRGENQTVCVVDSGIDYTHDFFGGYDTFPNPKIVGGYNFVSNNDDPMDDQGHGTHVAGIVAGNTGSLKGVAPEARLAAVKVLNSTGGGRSTDVYDGIMWCVTNAGELNITTIVLSLGSEMGFAEVCESTDDHMLPFAVNYAYSQGLTVVAAAGNGYDSNYQNTVVSPACSAGAIAVGNSNKNDEINPNSNAGSLVEIYAPGTFIYSAVPNNDYWFKSGTSMSAPMVAGAAAILAQRYSGQQNMSARIRQDLTSTQDIIFDSRTGRYRPRLNVLQALNRSLMKGIIPTEYAEPFYTTSENPQQVTLTEAGSVLLNWTVHATGDSGDHAFFAFGFNQTTYIESNHVVISYGSVLDSCSVLTNSEIVLLDEDIVTEDSCFSVQSHNVVIDGRGFMLSGNGVGFGISIINATNVTIKNLNIQNFSEAIRLVNSSVLIHNNKLNATTNLNVSLLGGHIVHLNTTKTDTENIIGGFVSGGNFWASPGGDGFSETCEEIEGICVENYVQDGLTDYVTLAFDVSAPELTILSPLGNVSLSSRFPLFSFESNERVSFCNMSIFRRNQTGSYVLFEAIELITPYRPSSIVPEGLYQWNVSCFDLHENFGVSNTYNFTIDRTRPKVVANVSREPNVHGWYNEPFTISFNATDILSGIAHVEWFNSTSWEVVTGNLTINRSLENNELRFRAVDNAGNKGFIQTLDILYDDVAPEVLLFEVPSFMPLYAENISYPFYLHVQDSHSGIAYVNATINGSAVDVMTDYALFSEIIHATYSADGTLVTNHPLELKITGAVFNISDVGIYELNISVTNFAGNTVVVSEDILVTDNGVHIMMPVRNGSAISNDTSIQGALYGEFDSVNISYEHETALVLFDTTVTSFTLNPSGEEDFNVTFVVNESDVFTEYVFEYFIDTIHPEIAYDVFLDDAFIVLNTSVSDTFGFGIFPPLVITYTDGFDTYAHIVYNLSHTLRLPVNPLSKNYSFSITSTNQALLESNASFTFDVDRNVSQEIVVSGDVLGGNGIVTEEAFSGLFSRVITSIDGLNSSFVNLSFINMSPITNSIEHVTLLSAVNISTSTAYISNVTILVPLTALNSLGGSYENLRVYGNHGSGFELKDSGFIEIVDRNGVSYARFWFTTDRYSVFTWGIYIEPETQDSSPNDGGSGSPPGNGGGGGGAGGMGGASNTLRIFEEARFFSVVNNRTYIIDLKQTEYTSRFVIYNDTHVQFIFGQQSRFVPLHTDFYIDMNNDSVYDMVVYIAHFRDGSFSISMKKISESYEDTLPVTSEGTVNNTEMPQSSEETGSSPDINMPFSLPENNYTFSTGLIVGVIVILAIVIGGVMFMAHHKGPRKHHLKFKKFKPLR